MHRSVSLSPWMTVDSNTVSPCLIQTKGRPLTTWQLVSSVVGRIATADPTATPVPAWGSAADRAATTSQTEREAVANKVARSRDPLAGGSIVAVGSGVHCGRGAI